MGFAVPRSHDGTVHSSCCRGVCVCLFQSISCAGKPMEDVSSSSAPSPSAFVSSCSLFSSLPLLQEQSIFLMQSKIAMVLELGFYTLPFTSLIFFPLCPSPSSGSPGSAWKEQRYRSIMSYWFLFDCRERGGEGRKLPCENLQLHFSKTLCCELGLTWKKTPLGCRGLWLRARAPLKRSVCFSRSCSNSKVATSALRLFLPTGPLFAHSVFT